MQQAPREKSTMFDPELHAFKTSIDCAPMLPGAESTGVGRFAAPVAFICGHSGDWYNFAVNPRYCRLAA